MIIMMHAPKSETISRVQDQIEFETHVKLRLKWKMELEAELRSGHQIELLPEGTAIHKLAEWPHEPFIVADAPAWRWRPPKLLPSHNLLSLRKHSLDYFFGIIKTSWSKSGYPGSWPRWASQVSQSFWALSDSRRSADVICNSQWHLPIPSHARTYWHSRLAFCQPEFCWLMGLQTNPYHINTDKATQAW